MGREVTAGDAWTADVRPDPLFAFAILLAAYHFAFGGFFPTPRGTVGGDYSFVLPNALSGYYWIKANGILAVPWFTPAFCGGIPFYGDAQVGYSVIQLATLFIDPLGAAYLTTLLFAGLGYWGCYGLLRHSFGVAMYPAIVGAAIFMFNGFFSHRMIAGHFGFHGFMLVPWMAWLLTMRAPLKGRRWLGTAAIACSVGLIAAYWLQSGLGTLILPTGLAVLLILLLHALLVDDVPVMQVVLRACTASLVAVALSASKLVVTYSMMSNFPRSGYLLPGYRSVTDAFRIGFTSLFFSPTDIASLSNAVLENVQWEIGRHELEHGVTVVPLVILVAGLVLLISGVLSGRTRLRLDARKIGILALIGLVLLIPLVVNTYSPRWNAILKQTPLLSSASNVVRWFCVYIPFVAVLAAVVVARWPTRVHVPLAVTGVAAIIVLNLLQDRSAYAAEAVYRPEVVQQAYRAVQRGSTPPPIESIGAFVDGEGRIVMPVDRNNALTAGISPLHCYNPTFGYLLENLPFKDLRPGAVRQVTDGHYNIKNPACYVFPKENGCAPGDHFRVDQTVEMERFVAYRPFAFKMSTAQRVANAISLLSFAASVVVLAWAALAAVRRRRPRQPQSGVGEV